MDASDNPFDLPDSTDWLSTPLPLLTPLESSLRCQVCKDLFDNPVITSCSHTFCSLCIRRCLSTEGKCPACRSSDQELKLRRNWVVQELVDAFRNARPSLLEVAREAAAPAPAPAMTTATAPTPALAPATATASASASAPAPAPAMAPASMPFAMPPARSPAAPPVVPPFMPPAMPSAMPPAVPPVAPPVAPPAMPPALPPAMPPAMPPFTHHFMPPIMPPVQSPATTTGTRVEEGGNAMEQPMKKRRVDNGANAFAETSGSGAGGFEGRQTRSRTSMANGGEGQTPMNNNNNTPIVIEDDRDGNHVPNDGFVPCPICHRKMKHEAVFQHLDVCPGTPSNPSPAYGTLRPDSYNTSKPPERLPAMNYSILKDGVLRKKLRDLGIPNWGSRSLLQRRHTEWMNLWNANCDSKTPKSKRELLHELDIWERTQGGLAAAPSSAGADNSVLRKDFDGAAWSVNHDSDFKRLIASAKQKSDAVFRKNTPQTPAAQSTPEDSSKPERPVDAPIATDDVGHLQKLTAVPQAPAAENTPELSSKPEQPIDAPIATNDAQQSTKLTAIPQSPVAQITPEQSSKPGRPIDTPIATDDVRQPMKLPVNPTGVEGSEREAVAFQNNNDTQAVNANNTRQVYYI